jgi:cold shock CspA family protein
MPIGRIVRFNADRGFGFVEPDSEPGSTVFIHISRLILADIKNPKVGTPIVYETGMHKGKPCVVSCEALRSWQVEKDDTDDSDDE